MTKHDIAVLSEGLDALHFVAQRLRREANAREDSGLWLAVRDVESLTQRLEGELPYTGELPLRHYLGGQDFGVMDDIGTGALEKDRDISMGLTEPQRESIRRLREYLAANV
jgi:hypothetical protein